MVTVLDVCDPRVSASGDCATTQVCNARITDSFEADQDLTTAVGVCVTLKAAGSSCEVGYGKLQITPPICAIDVATATGLV